MAKPFPNPKQRVAVLLAEKAKDGAPVKPNPTPHAAMPRKKRKGPPSGIIGTKLPVSYY